MAYISDTINAMLKIRLDHFKTADKYKVLKDGTKSYCCYEKTKRYGSYAFRASIYANKTFGTDGDFVVTDVKEILNSQLSFPSNYYDILRCTISIVDVNGILRFPHSFEKICRVSLLFGNFQLPELCGMKFLKRSLLFEQADELLPGDVLTLLFDISYLSKAGMDHNNFNVPEMNYFQNYIESFVIKDHQTRALVEKKKLTTYAGSSAENKRDSSTCTSLFHMRSTSDRLFSGVKDVYEVHLFNNETRNNSVVKLQHQNLGKVSPSINQIKIADESDPDAYGHGCLTQSISMNSKKVAGTSSHEVQLYGSCNNLLEKSVRDTNELKCKSGRKEAILADHEWTIQTDPEKIVVSFERGKDTYGSKILAASPVFRCLVNIPMKEKLEKFIDLSHIKSQSFKNLLHYLDQGNIYFDTHNDVADLYKIAHMYDIKDLLPVCAFYWAKSMNPITRVLVKELADFYSDELLMGYVESYDKGILKAPISELTEDETNRGNDRPDMNCYI